MGKQPQFRPRKGGISREGARNERLPRRRRNDMSARQSKHDGWLIHSQREGKAPGEDNADDKIKDDKTPVLAALRRVRAIEARRAREYARAKVALHNKNLSPLFREFALLVDKLPEAKAIRAQYGRALKRRSREMSRFVDAWDVMIKAVARA